VAPPTEPDRLTDPPVAAVSSDGGAQRNGGPTVHDPDLVELRQQAGRGNNDAVAQLVELAGERGDFDELRALADGGSSDAVDVLVELAGERGDRSELRRLAASGHQDAVDVLAELDGDLTDVEVD
jgi:hypothetical protein